MRIRPSRWLQWMKWTTLHSSRALRPPAARLDGQGYPTAGRAGSASPRRLPFKTMPLAIHQRHPSEALQVRGDHRGNSLQIQRSR